MFKGGPGRNRGLSLASVLVMGTITAVAAFSMAAITLSHLSYSNHYAYGQDATYLAESVVADALSQMQKDNTFGTHQERLVFQPDPNDATRIAVINFDPSQIKEPFSTNNFDGKRPTGFNAVPLQKQTALLLATSTAAGQTRTLEVLVNITEFPYVIASAGAFDSDSALTVQEGGSLASFAQSTATGLTSQSAPGAASMASNVSVHVGGKCVVTGDVTSPGPVTFDDPTSTVGGSIQTGTAFLPDVNTADFDATKFGAFVDSSTELDTPAPLDGSNFFRPANPNGGQGTLTVRGDLTLNSALLFVDGNIVIFGGLAGSGGLVCTGSVTVNGGVNVVSDKNLVALVADGDVTLAGSSITSQKPFFQGLVYTRGNFTASNLTIAGVFLLAPPKGATTGGGSLLSADSQTSTSQMKLQNVDVVDLPEARNIQVALTPNPVPPPPTPPAAFNPNVSNDGLGGRTVFVSMLGGALNMQSYYDPVHDRFDPSLATLQNSISVTFDASSPSHINFTDGFAQAIQAAQDPRFQYANVFAMCQQYLAQVQQTIANFNAAYQANKAAAAAPPTNVINFGLNQFFDTNPPLRILSWRQL